MKKYALALLTILFMAGPLSAQNTYLVNKCKVVKSENCTIYKYNGNSSAKIRMAGGEYGCGGFSFWDEGAFVTFDLGGQYEFLTFTLAHDDSCSEKVGVVTAIADGTKIFDEKVRGYEPPRVYTLNVSGADQLTFRIAASDIDVVVADAILWKTGQKPVPVTRPTAPPAAPKELVKDIKPFQSRFLSDNGL